MSLFKKEEVQYDLFDYLNGRVVSVLVDNPKKDGIKESYIGVLQNTEGEWIYLSTEKNNRIKGIFLRKSFILSIWEY